MFIEKLFPTLTLFVLIPPVDWPVIQSDDFVVTMESINVSVFLALGCFVASFHRSTVEFH